MKWNFFSARALKKNLPTLACGILLHSSFAQSDEQVTICMAENHAIHWVAREILLEIYNQSSLTPQFIQYPNSRSMHVANKGGCMAEAGRIEQAGNRFKNLIIVKPEILTIKGYAYSSAKKPITVSEWSDLSNYTVGQIRGELYAEIGTRQAKNVVVVEDYLQLFSLLKRGRIDLAIGLNEPATQAILKTFEKRDFHRAETALHKAKLYHFVHQENNHLVEKLSPTLDTLHSNGRLSSLYAKAIGNLEASVVVGR